MDALITTPTLLTMLTHIMRFRTPFVTPPQVVVWLTGLGAATGVEVNIPAVADKITKTRFELRINSGDGAPLESVGAAGWTVLKIARDGERHVTIVCSYSSSRPRVVKSFEKCVLSNCLCGLVEMAAVCLVGLALERGLRVEVEGYEAV